MARTAVIAGVGPRLGEALARKFVEEGCRVGLLARSNRATGRLADELGDRALALEADITDVEELNDEIGWVRDEFGPVDVLVHNASAPGGNGIDDATTESLRETWTVRTGGLVNCVRACLSDLREREGRVIISGTNYAIEPDSNQIEWASAAGATRNVARALRDEPFYTTYVAITRAVSPPESEWDGAISADAVAERYWELTERDGSPERSPSGRSTYRKSLSRTTMFGTSGIRGPVGEEVTADLALRVGRALGVDSRRVVVGRDPRESGRFLTDALAAGLCESGTDVVDLGLAATPTVARAVSWYDADAGVSVTASHNPPEDNGIKLWQESGQAFDESRREEIATRVREGTSDLAPWNELGTRVRENATDRHVDALVATTDLDATTTNADDGRLPVAIDLGNGAGGVTVKALSELGCDIETLNAQPDGSFPARPSEPNEDTLSSLCAFVAGTDCVVGLAQDGDADRLVAVDGDGEFVPKDALLAIFAADAASEGEQVACPVDTSLAVEDFLRVREIGVTYTPVGDVYVAEALGGEVTFGGEPSGAWIWPAQTLCPDGPLAACRLVSLCAERPLADRVEEIPAYPIDRANVAVDDREKVMDRVRERAGDEGDVTTLDGVRVDTENGWFLVRASGTQPLVRITAEARSEKRAETLATTARDLVENARP